MDCRKSSTKKEIYSYKNIKKKKYLNLILHLNELIIRGMQIKTIQKYQVLLIRMANVKKKTNTEMTIVENMGKLEPLCWVYKIVQQLWKTLWCLLKKLS